MEESTSQAPGVSAVPGFPGEASVPANTLPVPAVAPVMPAAPSAPIPAPEPVALSAVREDQIQNAVGFLSHPQVRSSTNTASKRSFLERKGLNAAEIDEAFRRVPEAPPPAAPAPVAPPAAAPAPSSTATAVPQPAAYAPQPSVQPHAPPTTSAGSQMVAMQPTAPTALMPQVAPTYRWSQVVLGVGAVFAAGWVVHQLVVPRLWGLVESWQTHRREAEEARHKELHAAVSSLKSCQEELKVSTQALLEAVNLMREQQQERSTTMDGIMPTRGSGSRPVGGPPVRDSYYNPNMNGPYGGGVLGADNYAAIRAAAGYTNAYPPDPPSYTVSYNYGRGDSGPATAGPTAGDGSRSGAAMYVTSNTPYSAVRNAAANPYSGPGSGGVTQQQQQDNLPYRVTAPPSPAHSTHSLQSGRQQQQPTGGLSSSSGPYGSSDRLYEQTAPGPSSGGGGGGGHQQQQQQQPPKATAGGESSAGADGRTVPPPPPEQPAYPESFMTLMEMVQQGITPPNVRTDINDAPPDPTRPLSEARMPALLKPWERATAAGPAGGSGAAMPSSVGRASGMSYSWGMGSQMEPPPMTSFSSSLSLALPPTAYGIAPTAPSSTAATGMGGVGGASGSAGSSTAGGGGMGRDSNSDSAGGGSGLSVLPPVNPAWRPPPPPARTVIPPNSSSSSPSTGPAGGAGVNDAAPGLTTGAGPSIAATTAAGNAPVLSELVTEPATALAGPPSPSPSQPALAASATEVMRTQDVSSTGLPGAAVASPTAPAAPPASRSFVLGQQVEGLDNNVFQAANMATHSPSAVPSMATP